MLFHVICRARRVVRQLSLRHEAFIRCLLCLRETNQAPIRALHSSFFDFLTEESRSKSYYVEPSHQHHSFALSRLRTMRSGLCFNICDLKTSRLRNSAVSFLAARVERKIL